MIHFFHCTRCKVIIFGYISLESSNRNTYFTYKTNLFSKKKIKKKERIASPRANLYIGNYIFFGWSLFCHGSLGHRSSICHFCLQKNTQKSYIDCQQQEKNRIKFYSRKEKWIINRIENNFFDYVKKWTRVRPIQSNPS